MALNITDNNIRFSNENCIYVPSKVSIVDAGNLNNDYFPNETLTITSTSASLDSATLDSATATPEPSTSNHFTIGEGTNIKISGTYTIGLDNIPNYTQSTNTFETSSSNIGIGTYPPSTISSGSSNNDLRIYNGTDSGIKFSSANYVIECSENDYDLPELHYMGMNSEEFKKHLKRLNIKSNLRIKIKSRADLIRDIPENEQIAIETLRENITETEFRKYIKYGFVLAKGQSGKTYQIFRNHSHTKVWRGGKLIEEVCVRIRDYKIPPTDSVIAFLNMVQIDEEEFRKSGNIYNMRQAA